MEREGKQGLARMSRDSIGQVGVVEVQREVGDEVVTLENVLIPRMAVSEVEVGLERPSGVVHGRLQFGWNHQWISIDRLRSVSRTERV